jgi:hypothetical protein
MMQYLFINVAHNNWQNLFCKMVSKRHCEDKETYGGQITFNNSLKFYISRVETLQKDYNNKCMHS